MGHHLSLRSIDLQGAADAGAVTTLYGAPFADGLELGALDRWSSALP